MYLADEPMSDVEAMIWVQVRRRACRNGMRLGCLHAAHSCAAVV